MTQKTYEKVQDWITDEIYLSTDSLEALTVRIISQCIKLNGRVTQSQARMLIRVAVQKFDAHTMR